MRKTKNLLRGIVLVSPICLMDAFAPVHCFSQGNIELEVFDKESGQPVSARIVFSKSAKKLTRPKNVLFAGGQWLAEAKFKLAPPNGDYEFLVQRGPEFNEVHGGFTIERGAKDSVPIEIPRSVDMHSEYWYSGDHFSSLPSHELNRWQLADAVDFAVSTDSKTNLKSPSPQKARDQDKPTEPNGQERTNSLDVNRVGLGLSASSHYLEWANGALLLHGATSEASKSIESGAFAMLDEAIGNENVFAELLRPWSRDVPLLLASEAIRSVQLLSSYNRPDGDDRIVFSKVQTEGTRGKVQLTRGKEKTPSEVYAPIDADDVVRFKDPRGVGKLSETIYWQMLEAGLQITPTAGSGFNGHDTHVGYNRVYVYSATQPELLSWWRAIAQSHTFVTNGPLLRANINGLPPGSTQTSYRAQSIALDINVSLSVREPVDYLDVVFNGDTIYSAKLEDHYKRGEFPPIEIDKSGWLVIRIVTDNNNGYRFATTAPFYFVFDGKPRVSRKAVSYFQQWQKAAADHLAESPNQLKLYQPWIERSTRFWESRMIKSNAD